MRENFPRFRNDASGGDLAVKYGLIASVAWLVLIAVSKKMGFFVD